jgi:hypothetical protein
MKLSPIAVCLASMLIAGLANQAVAQSNNFFGSGVGGPTNAASSGNLGIGGPNDGAQGAGQISNQGGMGMAPSGNGNAPSGEYSQDEKRVQHKYKSYMSSARKLVAKGEDMMKSKDEKTAKKGKILKEIGEKRIADLKANSPFPEIAGREPKKVN